MSRTIFCPCGTEFEGEEWTEGNCPSCNDMYWFEEGYSEDYSEHWVEVWWDRWSKKSE